ncbi:MAG: penicillin-binding protein 1C [Pseudomonadota bacterium]
MNRNRHTRSWLWLGLLALLLLASGITRDGVERWITATKLPPIIREVSTEVRDRDGELLRVYTVENGRWRLAVTPDMVDRTYIEMLIAYEDKRFYNHAGVDPLAFLRAFVQAIWHGELVSGGSTLTMQVARLLENSGTGRLSGKLRQMRVALALERKLSKDQILQLYLEHAPFGGNLEGVRAASYAWFGKEPKRLTPAEASLLVALPQAPEARRPDTSPDSAMTARSRVLARALKASVISQGDAHAAITEALPNKRRAFPSIAPHIADRALRESPAAKRHDLTLRKSLQTSLENLAKRTVRTLPEGVSVAIIVADHTTGEILSSVGSADYSAHDARQGFVDMTQAFRSPGSTLKPLIYGMAFDRGLAHPQTLITDKPVSFGTYAPQNFDGAFRGDLTVTEALRQSLNIPVVLLLDALGPAHLLEALRKSHVQTKLPGDTPGLAVGLGGIGITPEGLTQLYAMIAGQGQVRRLHWRKDNRNYNKQPVLSRSSAWQVGDILVGLAPPRGFQTQRLAYKTGTSYGHRDAWAVGFDGRHVATVWIGRPNSTPVPGAFGGDLAAPVLFEVFQRIKPAQDALPPPPPETLLLSTAQLPKPLRRFAGRTTGFETAKDAPKLIFPPDGAKLLLENAALTVKMRDGIGPFTWLANGMPVKTGERRRETQISGLSQGYSKLSVIDAAGRAASVTVWID